MGEWEGDRKGGRQAVGEGGRKGWREGGREEEREEGREIDRQAWVGREGRREGGSQAGREEGREAGKEIDRQTGIGRAGGCLHTNLGGVYIVVCMLAVGCQTKPCKIIVRVNLSGYLHSLLITANTPCLSILSLVRLQCLLTIN